MKSVPQSIRPHLFIALILIVGVCPAPAQDVTPPAQDVDVQATFEEAQSLVQDKKFSEAAELLAKCIKTDEKFGPGWFLYGYALHMDKRYDEAIKAHRRASEFEDDQFQSTAIYNLACALALTGKPGEALDALQKAIDAGFNDPFQIGSDSDLYSLHTGTRFAVILAKLNDEPETAAQLEDAQQAIENNDFPKAIELYQAIVEREPKNDFACYRLGFALHGAGKLDEALVYHEKATKFPATKGIALYNWGCALSLKGEEEKAIAKLEEAIDAGFLRMDAYQNDPDLDNLRDQPAFDELVKLVQARLETNQAKPESKTAGEKENSYSVGIQMRVEHEEGVVVEEVMPGSAAERDGLLAGDRLIRVADAELGSEPIAVLRPYLQSGEVIPFEIERDGKTMKIKVKPNPR